MTKRSNNSSAEGSTEFSDHHGPAMAVMTPDLQMVETGSGTMPGHGIPTAETVQVSYGMAYNAAMMGMMSDTLPGKMPGEGMAAAGMVGMTHGHVLTLPDAQVPSVSMEVQAKSTMVQYGTTAHFSVYYDTSLGIAKGQMLAEAVLTRCEDDYNRLQTFFGGLTIPAFRINIIPGSGGAYHMSCAATELFCEAFDGNNADLVRMLLVAEADEVFMAVQGTGWNCGASNGEGLSRVLATQLYPDQLNGFASASSWLNSNRPDFVSVTDKTDTNYISIGCATLFINYLRSQLGYSLNAIVQAGGKTLQQTYKQLTGKSDAFGPFAALLQEAFPAGTPVQLPNDNPFPLSSPSWKNWASKSGVTLGAPGWSSWQSLDGVLTSDISVGINADGRLEAFVRGSDNGVWHIWQTAPNNGWSGWSSLSGIITSDPIVASNADGRLEVFARGQDNGVWHSWQTAPNGGWSGWATMGGVITSDPIVASNADGRLEVFARGQDNGVWHSWQTAPNGGWSGWATMGGVITSDIALGMNADGRLEVFARGLDNGVWHIWQTAPNNGWSVWASLGGIITSDPVVASNADGRLEVFVRGLDNGVWHSWQTAPNNGWSGWASLGGVITSDITVGINTSGRLEIFARGQDNGVWHSWQTAPNNGWSGWASLSGVIISDPTVTRNADGRLEVFGRGLDNGLWHNWQTAPA